MPSGTVTSATNAALFTQLAALLELATLLALLELVALLLDAVSVGIIGAGGSGGTGVVVGALATFCKIESETPAGSLIAPAALYARTTIVWVPTASRPTGGRSRGA